jgi:uncharacterized membrane protein YbhN (UPF0104 family)
MIKNKKLNIIILILITCLVLYFSLKDNFMEVINQILKMDFIYLFIAFLLVPYINLEHRKTICFFMLS